MATSSTTVDPNMLQLTDPPTKQVHCASDVESMVSHSPTAARTLAAIRARNKAKSRPKKVPKPSTTPATESDKLMYASETYIGPLKKKGRPKNPSIGAETLKNPLRSDKHHSDFQVRQLGINSSTLLTYNVQFLLETKPVAQGFATACNSATSPLPDSAGVATQTHNYNSIIELLASISNPGSSNAALLATLSTIDSPTSAQQNVTNQEPSPSLANALRQLLSTFMNQTSQNSSQQPSDSSHPAHGSITTSQDEDVVILDKENVDPLAFRRRGDKDLSDPKGNNNPISGTPRVDSGKLNHGVLSQRYAFEVDFSNCLTRYVGMNRPIRVPCGANVLLATSWMRESRNEISKERGSVQSEGICIDNRNRSCAGPQDLIPYMIGTQRNSGTIQG